MENFDKLCFSKDTSKIKKVLYQEDLPVDIFNSMLNSEYLFVDTETMGLCVERDRLCLVQILSSAIPETVFMVSFNKENKYKKSPNLKKLFNKKSIIKVFHYAYFDMLFLNKYINTNIHNVKCTRMLSKISRTFTDRHGLKTLCRDLLRIDLNKSEQSSFWGTDNLSEQQKEYAIRDVIYLPQILQKLTDIAMIECKYHIATEAFNIMPYAVRIRENGFSIEDLLAHRNQI